ncbi:unnamed protein product [Rangifer tarandus platyrhynchus]|uniref:Uncharacterized protein n=2 Tax=Rangifer tarandus platyrhynchus TaxID=3082113 RepID=A0ABN8Z9N5_RANTA|nr:unnamed protein product [Rangifer tarandus platyrhynchus]
MMGAGAVAAWCWRDFEEIPHIQGQRTKTQQHGRRGEITFRVKPHTCQRRSEGSNKPCAHQDPETPRRLRELCLSVSCRGTGQQWTATGQELRVQQTWVRHKPSWRRSRLTPP